MNNQKLHVLYILTKLELGGAQKVCLALFQGLQRQGAWSGLVSGNEGVLIGEVQKLPHTFLLKNFKREVGLSTLFNELKAFIELVTAIRKLKRHHKNLIIHTHSTKAGILGRWAAWCAGIKVRIHTIHGYGFNDHQPALKWYSIWLLEFLTSFITTHYICVSAKDRTDGIRYFPRFAGKSSVIRAAVEYNQFFIPAKKIDYITTNQKPLIIGNISCFKPQKNLLDLLKAFQVTLLNTPALIAQHLELHLIGDGLMRKEIDDWITQHHLTHKIKLLGWQHNTNTFLRSWDIFALSSLWEGLPCSVVEARLSKLPVVAYNVGGINEVIFEGKNGFLISPGDWQTLAEKLALIVQDASLRALLSNFPDNLKDFDQHHMITQHHTLYTTLTHFPHT